MRWALALVMVVLAGSAVGLGFVPGKNLPGGGAWFVPFLGFAVLAYWWGAWVLVRGRGRPHSAVLLALIPMVGPFLLAGMGNEASPPTRWRGLGTLMLALPWPVRFALAPVLDAQVNDPALYSMLSLLLGALVIALGLNGGVLYARSKGYSTGVGVLGLFSLLGLLVLFLLPDRTTRPAHPGTSEP